MKLKNIISFVLVIIILSSSKNSGAQAIDEKDVFLDAYYGIPYMSQGLAKQWAKDNGNPQLLIYGGFGHMGLRSGILVSEKHSLGLLINASSESVSFHTKGDTSTAPYDTKLVFKRLVILPTFTFHNLIENEKLDMFFSIGVGYMFNAFDMSSTKPGFNNELQTGIMNANRNYQNYTFPFFVRLSFGVKRYFTPNIGALAEIGIGGPLLNFGATLRLPHSK